tara:strand:- start:131 stop:661 length:531 start_codon:yes stop_codon:yes gene_type:complete
MRKRLGVMCSGNGTNFENIVRSCKDHEVVLMLYNSKGCGAKKRATKLGIPSAYFDNSEEDKMISELNWARVDYIILAGWMRILTEGFVNQFHNRIINVHPSLLPKYKGLHAVEQAMESGDKETGCTVHYVNEELDGGKIIKQAKVPIFENDTVRELTKRIQREEYRILPEVINKLP